jgi:adenylyltransferase/sulfurtransferase
MATAMDALRQQIVVCEGTLQDLRQQLAEAEHVQKQQEKVLRQKPTLSHDPLDHDMNFWNKSTLRSKPRTVSRPREDGRLRRTSTRDMDGN